MTKILRLSAVIERTGLPRSTIYRYVEQEEFPAPIRIGNRSVGWLENEIHEWIQDRVQASRNSLS